MDPLLGIGRDVAQLIREPVRSLSRETIEDGTVVFFFLHGLSPNDGWFEHSTSAPTVGRNGADEPCLPAPPEA